MRLVYWIKRCVERFSVKRGDIYYADLRPVVGSEQGGIRPVLIIQNDVGNTHSENPDWVAVKGYGRVSWAELEKLIEDGRTGSGHAPLVVSRKYTRFPFLHVVFLACGLGRFLHMGHDYASFHVHVGHHHSVRPFPLQGC